MKAIFKDYLKKSQAEVEPNVPLKRQLSDQLFSQKFAKKSFWTWTKALFTAPAIAVLVVVMILTSNQTGNVLITQNALAQAIQNTFNFDAFETTFGLPEDGQFHHRIMSYYNLYSPYASGSPKPINLWMQQGNVRLDQFKSIPKFISDQPVLESRMFIQGKNIFCSYLNIKDNNGGCLDAKKPKIPFTVSPTGPLYEAKNETLLQDVQIESIYSEIEGAGVHLTFSTSTPLVDAQLIVGNFRDGSYSTMTLPNEDEKFTDLKEGDFINHLVDGKYWASLTLPIITPFKEEIYFQLQKVPDAFNRVVSKQDLDMDRSYNEIAEESSMIYLFDGTQKQLTPLSSEQFLEVQQKYSFSQLFIDEVFYSSVLPALYVTQHPDQFTEPLSIETIKHEGEEVEQIQFVLPRSYFVEMGPVYQNPDASRHDSYLINLYLNENRTRFRGYSILENGEEVEALWVSDEILPQAEFSEIFNEANWKAQWTK